MENNTKKVIPIFFATDNNYVPFLAVALTSLLDNASNDYFYKIYILTTSLKKEYIEQLKLICRDARPDGVSIDFVSLTEEMDKSSGNFHLRDYYSKETYCRVFIPRVFPQYDKVIYLDCDIVVKGDISEFYNIDIGDNILGAASEEVMMEYDVFGDYVEKALGIPREKYFSAGVLLINAKKYREDDIETKFIDLMNTYTFRVTQDEDYLNLICKDNVFWLEQQWNTEVYGNIAYDESEFKIIHYIMVSKPWHYEDCKYANHFWKYAKETNYYDTLIEELNNTTIEDLKKDEVTLNFMLQRCEEIINIEKGTFKDIFDNGIEERL